MRSEQRGLTLIELMVTLAVAIVLLAIGIPAFEGFQANSRAAAQANAFVTALSLARMEAVSRGIPVSICPKDPNDPDDCGGATDWAAGWIVFTDRELDGTPSAARLVKSFDAPRGNPTIAPNPSGTALVRYNSRGEQAGATPAEVRFQLQQAETTSGQTRCVRVLPFGQVVTLRDVCPT